MRLDTSSRIYVADTYNNRIVRMDDMSGTNWTVLGSTTNQFINPYGMAVDPFGTIYVADSRDYRIVMADDMTGSAWTTYGTGGTGTGQFDSPASIFAVPATSPIGVPSFSTAKLTFGYIVIGTSSPAQSVALANIGSAPLEFDSIASTGDFAQTGTCAGALPAGQTCTANVTFTPTAGGTRTGAITFNFGTAGVNPISLSGIGTQVTVSPAALNFGNVAAGGRGASQTVTIANPGTATAGIASVTLNAPAVYHLKNQCPATLAAGANCTVTIRFTPQGAKLYNGALTITDASGTAQKVTITGTGVSN